MQPKGDEVRKFQIERMRHSDPPNRINSGTHLAPVFVGVSDDPYHPIELRIGLQSRNRIGYRAGSPRGANLSRSQARALAYSLLAISEEPEKDAE